MSETIIVDGHQLTEAEFIELQKNKNIKLKLIESISNTKIFKTLQKMFG